MAVEVPSWLNVDFSERILRLAEDDPTVEVIDVFSKPATSKGDNYTSDMMRVVIEFTRKQGEKKVNEKKTLIFKFEPIAEGHRKELIEKTQIFDTEIAMMTDTLNKMSDMLGYRLGARVFHVRMERPLCLIMEDLAPLGFRMADRQAGLDMNHCLIAIRALAKFHASSVALCEKEPKHKDMYKRGIFCEDGPEEMSVFFSSATMGLGIEMENWTELDKSYAEKVKKLAPHLFEKGIRSIKRKDDEFNVINHGDFWVNNMLFRYDENNKPIQHIFVDFQLSMYTSPAVDLHYFLNTSPNVQIAENNSEDLLQEYLRSLTAMLKQLGCKTKPPTMEQLKKSLKERSIYALIASVTVLPIILVDKSEAKDIDELLPKNGTIENPGFKSPIFRRIMTKRIPQFDAMGLLDC